MVIGGTTAAGAGLGAIFGGKKGALIGAALGGGAGTLFEVAADRRWALEVGARARCWVYGLAPSPSP